MAESCRQAEDQRATPPAETDISLGAFFGVVDRENVVCREEELFVRQLWIVNSLCNHDQLREHLPLDLIGKRLELLDQAFCLRRHAIILTPPAPAPASPARSSPHRPSRGRSRGRAGRRAGSGSAPPSPASASRR